MTRPTTPINLTIEQSYLLQSRWRRRETPHSLVLRSQIIWQSAQGINNKTIGLSLGLCEETVALWRQRWMEGSAELAKLSGQPHKLRAAVGRLLSDRARSGSPSKFSAEPVCQFIALACETPPEYLSHWTLGELAREALKRGVVKPISTSTAERFLKSSRPQAASYQILAPS